VNETFKTIVSMALVCVAAGFIIALFHSSTAQLPGSQSTIHLQLAVRQVFASEIRIVDSLGKGSVGHYCWLGKKDSLTVGYAFLVESRGYCGPISAVVGIDTSGIITGVAIISENESPSIGGRIEETISKRTVWNGLLQRAENARPWFTEQFKGITPCKPIAVGVGDQWPKLSEQAKKMLVEKNTISAVSGATASTYAIVRAIEKTAAAFSAVRGIRQ